MNTLDKQYTALLQDILDNGVKKDDRTGTGTLSLFGRQIRHKMSDGFPLLTTKKVHFKSVVTELLWFLRGDTDIRYLWENNCTIWDGDWYKKYKTTCSSPYTLEEIKQKVKDGNHHFHDSMFDLGPIYGKQWRKWTQYKIDMPGFDAHFDETETDQIANSINLLKTNPDSRRNRVNAWNVGELDEMVLPPCHTDFQFFTRELSENERRSIFPELNEMYLEKKNHIEHYDFDGAAFYREKEKSLLETLPTRAISLMWNQRSVDTFLGLPFNIASYGLLLEIIAKEVNMVPDELIGNLGDTHLYLNHIEQAKEQIGRELSLEERSQYKRGNKETYPFSKWRDDMGVSKEEYFNQIGIPTRTREPYPLPTLKIENEVKWAEGDCLPTYSINDFTLENYQSHPAIKAPLSN